VHELQVRGLIPVIAPPERYLTCQRSADKLAQLQANGALLQGTMSAPMGVHGSRVRQTLWEMLESDQIYCLASDFHGGSYAELVHESVSQLTKQLSQPKVQQLMSDNPRRILTPSA
jgi:protein-tyrosine phosphatase